VYAPAAGSGFLDAVQASRFVFSMSIVIEHALFQCLGRTGTGIRKFGFLWTQLFFCISGFVLTYSTRRRGFPATPHGRMRFFLQRYLSVWFPYAFVWLATNATRALQGRGDRLCKGWLIPVELLLLQSWFPGRGLRSPTVQLNLSRYDQ